MRKREVVELANAIYNSTLLEKAGTLGDIVVVSKGSLVASIKWRVVPPKYRDLFEDIASRPPEDIHVSG